MEQDTPKYRGYFWSGHFLYLGRIGENSEHRHHSLQVIINREGFFRLGIDGSRIEAGGVVIRSDCSHQLLSSSDCQVHMLIDHEADEATMIARMHLGEKNVKILDLALLERIRKCIDVPGNVLRSCGHADAVYKKIISELCGHPSQSAKAIDPRIGAVVDLLRERYLSRKLPIAELARHACLSQSRLIHLFTEEIGIPLRRYVLWLRLMTATQLAVQGASLTEAAHEAGFSDSAHLSRTFRRTYGITLSGLLKNSRFVQVIFCPA